MIPLHEKVAEATAAIRRRAGRFRPKAGIILGTGLGGLAREIRARGRLPYGKIPHFPSATVQGHAGQLVWGTLAGTPVVAMEGRSHVYEGHPLEQITLPVRVLRALGARVLLVSNACGAMNPQFRAGDLMFIEDHINLMGVNPLIGPNADRLGPRFPDMSEPYDHSLIARAERIALRRGIRTHRGVYVAVSGPNLETRAEYRLLRALGADVVGMSTVPEVLVAVHAGMKVLGLSIVTDRCLPDALKPVAIEEILRVAAEAEPKLTAVVRETLRGL